MKIRYAAVAGIFGIFVLMSAVALAADMSGRSDTGMSSSNSQQSAALSSDPQTVMQVQQALSDKGYFQGTADGKWNSKTKNAVKKFQQAQGINSNGQLDQQTLASLGIQSGSAAGGQQDMSSSGAGGMSSGQSDTESGAGGMSSGQSSTGSGAGGLQDDMSNPQSTTNGGQTNRNY